MEPQADIPTEMAGDVISRLCYSVIFCPFLDFSGRSPFPEKSITVSNILQPVFVASMVDHFVVAMPFRQFTLLDCLRYTEKMLTCNGAKYFLIYQIAQAMAYLQKSGFFIGNVSPRDLVFSENLWIELKVSRVIEELRFLLVVDEKKDEPIRTISQQGDGDDVCRISEWTVSFLFSYLKLTS